MQPDFFERIKTFNAMYQMGAIAPADRGTRVDEFANMLLQEYNEVEDVECAIVNKDPDYLVAMADWLGDLIVYCASEALRWGIPIEQVLHVIMDSNASKLQADGTALFVNGKLQKGPNYWKPEPKIKELLDDPRYNRS